MFKNLVRNNKQQFLEKYLFGTNRRKVTDRYRDNGTDEEVPVPVDPLYKGGYRKKEQQSTLTFAFTVFWLYLGFLSVPVHPSIGQTLVATSFLGFLTVD